MKTRRVAMIGAGAWGTAVGKVLADNGNHVEVWSFESEVADEINTSHVNSRYLPDVVLPDTLTAGTDLVGVVQASEYVILATPSLHILRVVREMLAAVNISEGRTPIGILTKGFIQTESGVRLIVETLEDYLPGFYKGRLVYISGPSHAEEVSLGKLTGLISASFHPRNAIRFRGLLNVEPLMVFSSLDVIGVQVSAAMKNVIAIAFGIMDALKSTSSAQFGDNTESLLLAAGLNEIQALALSLGATHPETFTSIAGVGDLDVTCRSQYGRNRRFGREIVEQSLLSGFNNLDDLIGRIDEVGYLPEGVVATRGARVLTERYGLTMPITEAVYRILNREIEPDNALQTVVSSLNRANFTGFLAARERAGAR